MAYGSPVYNLEVEKVNNYFAWGLLVHNCVDDPHSVKEAESEVERQAVIDWWDLTMSSRGVSRDARRVIIMQRLHPRDLAGHVLEQGGWEHLMLPMYYEPGRAKSTLLMDRPDPRTEEGELLTPNQFPLEKVQELEKNLKEYGAAGQLQQRPQPRGGGMFKDECFLRRVRASPYHAVARVRYWDRAATSDGGCYTAGVLMSKSPEGDFYVEDVVHGQWEPNERNAIMVATALKDRVRYGPHQEPVIYVEAERGSTGLESFQNLARKLAGFRVREDMPSGSKDVRAEPWADMCAAKTVVLVEDGTWDVNGYIQEHVDFRPEPGKRLGRWKDRVDSSSGAFNRLVALTARSPGTLHVLAPRRLARKRDILRLVVCPRAQLPNLIIRDEKCLLVLIDDPPAREGVEEEVTPCVTITGRVCDAPTVVEEPNGAVSSTTDPVLLPAQVPTAPGVEKLLDTLELRFADVDPADYQEQWDEPLPLWNAPCRDVMLDQALTKRLWAFLTRRRDPNPDVVVFSDPGDRRALSTALAINDLARQPRSAVFRVDDEAVWDDPAPNAYVYDRVRTGRALVV